MASRRKWHMLQLENQRLQVLAEVMFGILQLENQCLQEVETCRAAEIRTRMYILRDHPFHHPIDTPQFNPDMPYEFPLQWLHPDAPFHLFHDGPVPHQHPDQPADQADPEPEPMEEHFPEPVPEEDIPVEQISVSSSEPSSEEPLTASISGPRVLVRPVARVLVPLPRL
ncbi:hypothetical protein AHAS_Ahas20G0170000 [Arachis hypogaea]